MTDFLFERTTPIWMDGQLISGDAAHVHVLSHGLHYASCVFEGQRAYAGEIFKLRDHSERLIRSANLLDIDVPYTAEQIDQACIDALKASGLSDAYVRPVVWLGAETLNVSSAHNSTHMAIAVWPWGAYFSAAEKMKGIRLTLADYKRPSPETAPTAAKAAGLYTICSISKKRAEAAGFDDALMLDWRGFIAEATGANIFLIKNNEIHTPTPDCFLDGITRRTVIDLAKSRNMAVIERHIEYDELGDFSEIFLTGSAAEVTPVREIHTPDATHAFTPGKITKTLMDDYDATVHGWAVVDA